MKTARDYLARANERLMDTGLMAPDRSNALAQTLATMSLAASMIESREPPKDIEVEITGAPTYVRYYPMVRFVGDERKGERRKVDIGNHLDDGSPMFNRRSPVSRRKIDNRNDPLPTMAHAEAKIAALYRVIDNKDNRIGVLEGAIALEGRKLKEEVTHLYTRKGGSMVEDERVNDMGPCSMAHAGYDCPSHPERRKPASETAARVAHRQATESKKRPTDTAIQDYNSTRPSGEWNTDFPINPDPMTRRHRRMFVNDAGAKERMAERDATIEELRSRVMKEIKRGDDILIDHNSAFESIVRLEGERDRLKKVDRLHVEFEIRLRAQVTRLESEAEFLKKDRARIEDERNEAMVGGAASHARVKELEAEVEVSDKIIAERNGILDALPCPIHGQCVPHVLEWIESVQKFERQSAFTFLGHKP